MLSSRLIRSARLLIALVLPAASATAQSRDAISLKTRRVEATEAASEEFIRLAGASRDGVHGYAFVVRTPSAEDRAALTRRGVTILSRLTRTAYIARVTPNAATRDTAVTSRVRFFAISQPGDRVLPPLWNGRLDRFISRDTGGKLVSDIINPDSSVNVTVRLHDDIPTAAESSIVAGLPRSHRLLRSLWRATLSREAIRQLAQNDAVRWIDVIPGGVISDMDRTRAALHVDGVQGFNNTLGVPTGVTGEKSTVLVFDNGIDAASRDFQIGGLFATRVATARGPGAHGTLVAGVIGASGKSSQSNDSWGIANGGTSPYQWRGMAPLTQIVDEREIGYIDDAGQRADTLRTLALRVDLSNHSYLWKTGLTGMYDELSRLHDAMIRGDDAGDNGSLTPRLHVHSAGNSGQYPSLGDQVGIGAYQRGFFALDNQLKNSLTVGNYYVTNPATNSRLSKTSSLGPTYDGRIKPDVVAPGSFVKALGWCNAVDYLRYSIEGSGEVLNPCAPASGAYPRRNFYIPQNGTSVSAAVVTGMLTLVADQLKASGGWTFDPYSPLPSTLRAIAIHSATDLQQSTAYFTIESNPTGPLPVQAFPGPDFATGYGLVDAQAAVNLALNNLVREGVINATCDKQTLYLSVTDPTAPVKVTLAWDDPASVAPEVSPDEPLLINDLDLVLTDPAGHKHYPWLLDQQAMLDGAPIADDAQMCGMPVKVTRALHPTLDPNYVASGDPTNRDDPINASDLKPATTGKDHLNNVEQVVAPGMIGQWTVDVSGFAVDMGPQRYSLVGVSDKFHFLPPLNVLSTCGLWPVFCRRQLYVVCDIDPGVCKAPELIPIESDTFALRFRGSNRTQVLPLSAMCSALLPAQACTPADVRSGGPLTLRLGGQARTLRVEVFDGRGNLLARDTTASDVKEIRIPASTGERFVIVRLGAPRDGENAYGVKTYAVPITVRRR